MATFSPVIQWVGCRSEVITQMSKLHSRAFSNVSGSLSHMSNCCLQSTEGRLNEIKSQHLQNGSLPWLALESVRAGFLRKVFFSYDCVPKDGKPILSEGMRYGGGAMITYPAHIQCTAVLSENMNYEDTNSQNSHQTSKFMLYPVYKG